MDFIEKHSCLEDISCYARGYYVHRNLYKCQKQQFYSLYRIAYIEQHIPLFNISTGGCNEFFVEPDKVVTNIHGIAGRESVLVKSVDGKTTWKVEGVAGFDVKNDLVVLKIAGEGTPLPLGNSDVVRKGVPISIVGFPYGKYKITAGTVNRIRESDKWDAIKADISAGNSGNPTLNESRK